LSLILSLIFGAAQLVLGAVVVARLLRGGRWRAAARFALLLICLWFVCSGLAELLVSGMEAMQRISGHPSAPAFALWRGRIDAGLLIATAALFVALCLYPLLRRLPSTPRAISERHPASHSRRSP
jgi:hypothetical protein